MIQVFATSLDSPEGRDQFAGTEEEYQEQAQLPMQTELPGGGIGHLGDMGGAYVPLPSAQNCGEMQKEMIFRETPLQMQCFIFFDRVTQSSHRHLI